MLRTLALFCSGGIVASSVLLAWFGFGKSAISFRTAVATSGIGVGIGVGGLIYFGISDYDLVGSIFVAVMAAAVAGSTASLTLRSRRR